MAQPIAPSALQFNGSSTEEKLRRLVQDLQLTQRAFNQAVTELADLATRMTALEARIAALEV